MLSGRPEEILKDESRDFATNVTFEDGDVSLPEHRSFLMYGNEIRYAG